MKWFLVFVSFMSCLSYYTSANELPLADKLTDIDSAQYTVELRFKEPEKYKRVEVDSNSFAYYLRKLKLKPHGSSVKLYNGEFKQNNNVYAAVVDMEITPKDLQQCADAVMRLRGEYLFKEKKYNSIGFRFVSDGQIHSFKAYAGRDTSYKNFRKYMDYVFNYANTRSLYHQMESKLIQNMSIGDVLIQVGNPYGHAVIIVDICKTEGGAIKFMLAQSYMPAQETQILINPSDKSVWFDLSNERSIITPEWTFNTNDLRTWKYPF